MENAPGESESFSCLIKFTTTEPEQLEECQWYHRGYDVRLCRVQKACKRMNMVNTWLPRKDSSLRYRRERSEVSLATCVERLSLRCLGNAALYLVVSTITRQTLKSTCSMWLTLALTQSILTQATSLKHCHEGSHRYIPIKE